MTCTTWLALSDGRGSRAADTTSAWSADFDAPVADASAAADADADADADAEVDAPADEPDVDHEV